MRKFIAPLVLGALAVAVALPAGAHTRHTHHGKARCGQTHGKANMRERSLIESVNTTVGE